MSSTVVVIGGGYGGAAVAKGLDSEANVVLIDPRDAFMNSAGSLRGVTQPDWAARMFFPYKDFIRRGTLVRDHAVSVDPKGVTVSSGQRIEADYIVLATGSSYAYPAKPRSHSTEESIEDLRRTHEQLAEAERVLILGAGPVGLELAGEIKEVWPDRAVTIVDPAGQLLAGFQPEVRESLERQLAELNVEVRLGTSLSSPPPTGPGQNKTFTVTTTAGDEITADIWFRAHGVDTNSDYLTDGLLTPLNPRKQVPVTERLNVQRHEHVYALGDLTDVAEAKMAGYAMQHAEVVRQNISAQLKGEPPAATYQPLPFPMILLPLGPRGGVGQLPSAEGPSVAPTETVSQFKGADLFTGMLSQQFSPS